MQMITTMQLIEYYNGQFQINIKLRKKINYNKKGGIPLRTRRGVHLDSYIIIPEIGGLATYD